MVSKCPDYAAENITAGHNQGIVFLNSTYFLSHAENIFSLFLVNARSELLLIFGCMKKAESPCMPLMGVCNTSALPVIIEPAFSRFLT